VISEGFRLIVISQPSTPSAQFKEEPSGTSYSRKGKERAASDEQDSDLLNYLLSFEDPDDTEPVRNEAKTPGSTEAKVRVDIYRISFKNYIEAPKEHEKLAQIIWNKKTDVNFAGSIEKDLLLSSEFFSNGYKLGLVSPVLNDSQKYDSYLFILLFHSEFNACF